MYTPAVNEGRPGLLIRPMSDRCSVMAGVWFVHGASHDPAHLSGITHLLEHLTLRRCGTHDRGSLSRLIDRLGGEVDAWTSSDMMGVSVHTTADALPEALGLLTDAVLTPTFDPTDIDLERKVIQAELEMIRDDPAEQVGEAVLKAAWGDHPLARNVIGEETTFATLEADVVRQHHATLLRPGRLVAAVAGAVDPAEVTTLLAPLPLDAAPASPPLPPLQWHAQQRTVARPGVDQVHVRLVFPALPVADPRVPQLSVVNRALGVGASSRLFQRLRETEGLTYDIWSGLVLRELGGLLEIGWVCATEVCGEVWRLVREELARLPDTLDAEEVAVATECLVRGIQMDAETPAGLCSLDVAEVLHRGRRFDLDAAVHEIQALELEPIRTLADELLRPERMASAVCGPEGVALRLAS
jgi:predicted Zn-dependent peptidase